MSSQIAEGEALPTSKVLEVDEETSHALLGSTMQANNFETTTEIKINDSRMVIDNYREMEATSLMWFKHEGRNLDNCKEVPFHKKIGDSRTGAVILCSSVMNEIDT